MTLRIFYYVKVYYIIGSFPEKEIMGFLYMMVLFAKSCQFKERLERELARLYKKAKDVRYFEYIILV